MAFERIGRRPAAKAIIIPPKPGVLIPKAPMPRADAFLDEAKYWAERHLAAMAAQEDNIEQRDTKDLFESFGDIIHDGQGLLGMVALMEAQGGNPDLLTPVYSTWYRGSISLLAYAGLCRAILPEMREGVNGFVSPTPNDVSVCCDFSPNEPDRIGVHATRGGFAELGIDWPEGATKDNPTWFESDTVYAAAYTPATVTSVLNERFQAAYDQPFGLEREAQFGSIVPYLKAEVLQD